MAEASFFVGVTEYLVATVNGFGIVVETIYIILFVIYAPKGIKAKTAILSGILDVGILAAAVVVTQLVIVVLGYYGCGLGHCYVLILTAFYHGKLHLPVFASYHSCFGFSLPHIYS
ncbi:hypothetical protein VNO77_23628 [Canavalia gladiata]|uniref:Uncharacterized protein n=1 Tax=Canavalia gladiata TaxID=3824 RepID=A0AAN9L586_CANGL